MSRGPDYGSTVSFWPSAESRGAGWMTTTQFDRILRDPSEDANFPVFLYFFLIFLASLRSILPSVPTLFQLGACLGNTAAIIFVCGLPY